MKKFKIKHLCVFGLVLLTSCTTTDDLKESIDNLQPHPENSKVSLKIDNMTYVDVTKEPTPNPDKIKISTVVWGRDTSDNYFIKGEIVDANPMSLLTGGKLSLRLGKTIEVGKVIDVASMYKPSSGSGFYFEAGVGYLPRIYYTNYEFTKGSFKVVAFDGKNLSLELNLNSVYKYKSPTEGDDSKASTIVGTIKGILKE